MPAKPDKNVIMTIAPNHRTFVRVEKALDKYSPAIGPLFANFHAQLSAWRADTLADLQCEAHTRGVTYMVRNGSKAFVWINFSNKGLSVFVPGVKPADYPGAKPTATTPDEVSGALINVTSADLIPMALKAFQDGYKARI